MPRPPYHPLQDEATVTFILISTFLAWYFSMMLYIGWLVPRLQRFALKRLQRKSLTLRRLSDIGTSTIDPYRSLGAFAPVDLVRWRIENDPDASEDIRRIADIEDRIATLEVALHPTSSAHH